MNRYIGIDSLLARLTRNPNLASLDKEAVAEYVASFTRKYAEPDSLDIYEDEVEIKLFRGRLPKDCLKLHSVHIGHIPMNEVRRSGRIGKYEYSLRNGVMQCGFEKGKIKIEYLAMPVDEDGFPMVYEDELLIDAIIAYIKMDQYKLLFDNNKISRESSHQAQQDYSWAVGQYLASQRIPTAEEIIEVGLRARFSDVGTRRR